MDLAVIWFVAIAVLWTGYFVLEGFDFGVGTLLPVLGRTPRNAGAAPRRGSAPAGGPAGRRAGLPGAPDNSARRVMINAIGPVWDGNEVWLITAGGAMFAAFPAWYASLFSGLYLPLLLVLLALIGRGVAFEYRGKVDTERWRAGWDLVIFWGSTLPAFIWGVAFANIVRGVAMDADHIVTAGLLDLLNPYALLGGLTTLSLFTLHGAVFLSLKTGGTVRTRARSAVLWCSLVAVPSAAAFLLWTQIAHGAPWTWPLAAVAALALPAGALLAARGREGWSFAATALTIVLATVTLFGSLFPDVLPSTTNPAFSLTVHNASSADYTLTVMTWVAVFFLPLVLAYQAWSYWVFRRRISREDIDPASARGAGPEPEAPGVALFPGQSA